MLIWVFLIGVISILPVKWASDFVGGERTGFLFCLLASFLAPAVAIGAFRLMQGGFNGFLIAYIASLLVFIFTLRIPFRSVLGFAVIVLLLQIAIAMALISFGFGRAVV